MPVGIHRGITWWHHQMEAFSVLLALCVRNPPITGGFPSESPMTRSFDVFFGVRLNKRLNKQLIHLWFQKVATVYAKRCYKGGHLTPILEFRKLCWNPSWCQLRIHHDKWQDIGRLFHSPSLVTLELSMADETWNPIGWHRPFVIGWPKPRLRLPQS